MILQKAIKRYYGISDNCALYLMCRMFDNTEIPWTLETQNTIVYIDRIKKDLDYLKILPEYEIHLVESYKHKVKTDVVYSRYTDFVNPYKWQTVMSRRKRTQEIRKRLLNRSEIYDIGLFV